MPRRIPPRTRTRVLVAATVIGFLGFSAGAVLNQAIGRFAALPEDAKPIHFSDLPAPEPTAGGGPVAKVEPPVGDDQSPGDEPTPAVSKSASRPIHAPAMRTYTDTIVRRNIFDSTAVFDPNAAVKQGGGECKEGAAHLLATVVADQPTYSSALISLGGKDGGAQGFAVGDEVTGEGRIVTIEQKRVCLDGGSCLCMGGEAGRPVAAAGKPAEGGEDSGVTKLGDNRYAVDQSLIDEAMNNFEMLATQVKAYPHKGPDGQIDGYRLSSIRPSSLFSKLGIKNGDIVHGVNGTALTSTEGALSAFQTLKNEKNFSFDITRKNQKQTLEYEVR